MLKWLADQIDLYWCGNKFLITPPKKYFFSITKNIPDWLDYWWWCCVKYFPYRSIFFLFFLICFKNFLKKYIWQDSLNYTDNHRSLLFKSNKLFRSFELKIEFVSSKYNKANSKSSETNFTLFIRSIPFWKKW